MGKRNKETNSGYGHEKFPHQINVKLTDEDVKDANDISKRHFGGDVSGSQLVRILMRQGMKWYAENGRGK
jgi:hypothetical protein